MNISGISIGLLFISAVAIMVSLPLIFRMAGMNEIYGVRIKEAFRSRERWLRINRFGGALLLLWGVAVGVTGAVGCALERGQWLRGRLIDAGVAMGTPAATTLSSITFRYEWISASVVVGGMALVVAGTFVYAAKTKKP